MDNAFLASMLRGIASQLNSLAAMLDFMPAKSSPDAGVTPAPLMPPPATVVYPDDTTTPRPSVTAGKDHIMEWAAQNPDEARAYALRVFDQMARAGYPKEGGK